MKKLPLHLLILLLFSTCFLNLIGQKTTSYSQQVNKRLYGWRSYFAIQTDFKTDQTLTGNLVINLGLSGFVNKNLSSISLLQSSRVVGTVALAEMDSLGNVELPFSESQFQNDWILEINLSRTGQYCIDREMRGLWMDLKSIQINCGFQSNEFRDTTASKLITDADAIFIEDHSINNLGEAAIKLALGSYLKSSQVKPILGFSGGYTNFSKYLLLSESANIPLTLLRKMKSEIPLSGEGVFEIVKSPEGADVLIVAGVEDLGPNFVAKAFLLDTASTELNKQKGKIAQLQELINPISTKNSENLAEFFSLNPLYNGFNELWIGGRINSKMWSLNSNEFRVQISGKVKKQPELELKYQILFQGEAIATGIVEGDRFEIDNVIRFKEEKVGDFDVRFYVPKKLDTCRYLPEFLIELDTAHAKIDLVSPSFKKHRTLSQFQLSQMGVNDIFLDQNLGTSGLNMAAEILRQENSFHFTSGCYFPNINIYDHTFGDDKLLESNNDLLISGFQDSIFQQFNTDGDRDTLILKDSILKVGGDSLILSSLPNAIVFTSDERVFVWVNYEIIHQLNANKLIRAFYENPQRKGTIGIFTAQMKWDFPISAKEEMHIISSGWKKLWRKYKLELIILISSGFGILLWILYKRMRSAVREFHS
ncbi:hypothetical protein [Luteibaculum oceani]|uniref:Uncharacterized protein n=1 Tax=Luteibaculum oceani TaxID=1294296 RepID=A0A5C6VLN4_9FLAO|nr:hypothetical protein [Luteibaculum oceani]TXC85376.1 hypothetical protein FRX97_01760 [Luteibaculum oceani]